MKFGYIILVVVLISTVLCLVDCKKRHGKEHRHKGHKGKHGKGKGKGRSKGRYDSRGMGKGRSASSRTRQHEPDITNSQSSWGGFSDENLDINVDPPIEVLRHIDSLDPDFTEDLPVGSEGDVRLVPTYYNYAGLGRLDVYRDGKWGLVSNENWGTKESNVVCKQLGYNGSSSGHVRLASWFTLLFPPWQSVLSNVRCLGNENRYQDCQYTTVTTQSQVKKGNVNLQCVENKSLGCKRGWYPRFGKCYYISQMRREPYNVAKEICEENDGYLVKIGSTTEQKTILNIHSMRDGNRRSVKGTYCQKLEIRTNDRTDGPYNSEFILDRFATQKNDRPVYEHTSKKYVLFYSDNNYWMIGINLTLPNAYAYTRDRGLFPEKLGYNWQVVKNGVFFPSRLIITCLPDEEINEFYIDGRRESECRVLKTKITSREDYMSYKTVDCDEPKEFICERDMKTPEEPPTKKPVEECLRGKGLGYSGTQTTSASGKPCLPWSDNRIVNPERFPNKGLDGHNFCRNPDDDISPWCWISSSAYEYCNISKCDEVTGTHHDTNSWGSFCTPNDKNSRWVYKDWRCDGEVDCVRGEDEMGCTEKYLREFTQFPNKTLGYMSLLKHHNFSTPMKTLLCARKCVEREGFEFACKSFLHDKTTGACTVMGATIFDVGKLIDGALFDYFEFFDDDNIEVEVEFKNDKIEVHMSGEDGLRGNVCGDDWTIYEANISCKQAGYDWATDAPVFPAQQYDDTILAGVDCDGSEMNLQECRHKPWGEQECLSETVAGAICYKATETPDTTEPPRRSTVTTRKSTVTTRRSTVTTPIPTKTTTQPTTTERAAPLQCGIRPAIADRAALKSKRDINLADFGHVLRIVGGNNAFYGHYPWQVGLRYLKHKNREVKSTHWCGGTILNEYWIMSVAHCGWDRNGRELHAENITVRVGDLVNTFTDSVEIEFEVDAFIKHPNYEVVSHDYDMALIKIKPKFGKGIVFNKYVQPACLPAEDSVPDEDESCLISGWGQTGVKYATHLQGADVPLINQTLCNSLYGNTITDRMMCAGYLEGGTDSCSGDSGGPLVCKVDGRYTLFGATSWGFLCAQENFPGVYARVTEFLPWINSILVNI
ncbi:unnamed protein product [Owenia fusiformis]|uniref:Neurotrypsin n=1 Tax=Owenia fusiformis TaxID=6347 RepID=A0A8J1U5Q1_OWEFU|nr:unnamed protein product [Owenia fusiformis]